MMNPRIQTPVITTFQSAVFNTAGRGKAPPFTRYVKARGDPSSTPILIFTPCGYKESGKPPSTRYVKARGDPKGRVEKKRGDPGG